MQETHESAFISSGKTQMDCAACTLEFHAGREADVEWLADSIGVAGGANG
jgi:hypothetical protein